MSLQKIQSELHAPKNQINKFGNYNYRSCEDILTAVKPLLASYGYHLVISDEIVAVGVRVYVKATVNLYLLDKIIATSNAFAREAETKKGMDDAQITGACSSYARKYALNGMFCIDDNKDADTMDNSKIDNQPQIDKDIQKEITRIGGYPETMKGWELFKMDRKIQALSWLKQQKKEV